MKEPRANFSNEGLASIHVREGGNLLQAHFRAFCRSLQGTSRAELPIHLRQWLESRSEPRTMLALTMIGELRLRELRPDLIVLLKDIEQGRALWPYDAPEVEEALRLLS
jgi:hypothetical protein